uniref:Putative secreted protein n=1 Tax=Amblyomma triste TaxID=251400 RepID=A0A023G2T1_AMBTT
MQISTLVFVFDGTKSACVNLRPLFILLVLLLCLRTALVIHFYSSYGSERETQVCAGVFENLSKRRTLNN